MFLHLKCPPQYSSKLLRLKCKVSIVINSIPISAILPLSIIVPPQFIYQEYQARGLTHIYVVHLQPDRTTVQSTVDWFGTSVDIYFVKTWVMHSWLHRVVTHLPEIQSRYWCWKDRSICSSNLSYPIVYAVCLDEPPTPLPIANCFPYWVDLIHTCFYWVGISSQYR